MPEKVMPGPLHGNPCPHEAVCIHTKKVYDSCKEKECLQDLRVYLTCKSQECLENAVSVKAKKAELLWTYIDVQPITFQRGYYSVDVKYYYHIVAEACSALGRPREIQGVTTYNKRTILFGGEGSAKTFSSQMPHDHSESLSYKQNNLPIAIIETVDPVILATQMQESAYNDCNSCCHMEIPTQVCDCFEESLSIHNDGKQLFVTLGQFSILRLERDMQLLMPAYDFCMPECECINDSEDPCELFQDFHFPVDAFYPPKHSQEIPCSTLSSHPKYQSCQGRHHIISRNNSKHCRY